MELEDVPHQYVKNWCKHIEIHQENVSLVGQMVGLPIGAKRVDCRFQHGYSGMTVRQTSTIFIESNCYNCPHHAPVNSDNFGEAVISKVRDRRKVKNEVDRASQLLQGLMPANPTEVLAADVETDAKARELAGLLSSSEHKQEAADRLLQGARHRPTIISPHLASVLIGAFLDTQVGSNVMETLRLAGRHDKSILSIAVKGAIVALHEGRNVDSACMIIMEAVEENQITLTTELVSTVISWLSTPVDPFPHFGPPHPREPRTGPVESFKAFANLDRKLVEETVMSLLSSDQTHLVGTACAAVQILLEISPDSIAEHYFQPLLEALSQEREDEDLYVDASICQTYAKMLRHDPIAISKKLFDAIEKAGEDLQKALFHVFICDEAMEAAEVWIGPFSNLLTSNNLADQTKFELADLLSHVFRHCTDIVFTHLTSLFGVLAIITDRLDSKRRNVPSSDKMNDSYLEYEADLSALSGVSRNLREVISQVGSTDIDKTISEIGQLIRSSNTNVAASFKSELLLLLGDLGKRKAELAANIVPIVFPHLFDPVSFIVRGAAAKAYRELVMRNRSCLPEDAIVSLAALLSDQYLYPVKAAVEAFEWIKIENVRLAGEVVNRLITLYSAYREDPSQYHFLEKILAALLNVANSHSSFLPYAAPVIRNLAGHQYFYSAKDGLRLLHRLAKGHEEYQRLYLSALLDYYSRFDLEITTSQSGYHSEQSDTEFEELYDLNPELIKGELAKLLTVARAQKQSHNLVHFACLLITVGLYKEAAELFERYSALLPLEERHDWGRSRYQALALLLRVEIALTEADINKAKELLEQALEVISSQEKPKRNLPFGLEKVIPKEEGKPDFYTTWLLVRKSWLNLDDDPIVLQKSSEEIISRIKELRAGLVDQVDERVLQIQEELAAAAKFLGQWYQCVLDGDPGQEAKREAIKARLSEALKGSLTNGHEWLERQIKDQISMVDSLSATKGILEFLQELRLFPLPVPKQDLPVPRRWRSPPKQDSSGVETKEEPIPRRSKVAFAKVLVDGQDIPQVITIIARRIHDLRIELEIPEVDVDAQELYLIPMSTLPEDEYVFPRQKVTISKGEKTYDISGHLQFKHAQSEASEPIDIKINAYLHKPDGNNEPCTIFGQSQLKFRVLDEARLSAQGLAEAKAIEKVFTNLGNIISDISSASYKNEKELITSIINYAGYQLGDPSFTGLETDEKDFQKDVSRYLRIHFKRTDVIREVQSGRGFVDVLVRGVPVELKVLRRQEKLKNFIEASLPQVTQYIVSQGRRLGLLCILDVSKRMTPTPSLIDDVLVCKGRTGVGIDPSLEGAIGVVTIVVRGALYPASKLRT